MVATDREAGVVGHPVLSTYVVAALTPVIRAASPAAPWQHVVFLLGAEKVRGDVLDRLADACAASRTGLVLGYRSIPASVRERLGRGNAAVAFMRLGNAADAKAASEQIGTEHRFVLSQLTDTVGASVTDTTGGSYTSTVGTSDSLAQTSSVTDTSGHSRGHGTSRDSSFLPLSPETRSRSGDSSHSTGYSESEAVTRGISESTAWGISTARATGDSESQARTVQRSREFVVEPHELQQLPPSAMIITYPAADGRRVVVADANPGIFGLPGSTLASLDESRPVPDSPRAGVVPRGVGRRAVSWRTGRASRRPISGRHPSAWIGAAAPPSDPRVMVPVIQNDHGARGAAGAPGDPDGRASRGDSG